MGNRKKLYIILALLVMVVVAITYVKNPRRARQDSKAATSNEFVVPAPLKDTLPVPDSVRWLPDSTRLFYMGDSRVTLAKGFPGRHELELDGNVFFEVRRVGTPLIINTKLLRLTVVEESSFFITAPAKEEWAEIQVIKGNIRVKKAYPSQFNEPDTIRGNQMIMINRTIDLMEKEKFDATYLKSWRANLPQVPGL